MTDFGTGLSLDEQWDLHPGPSGDLTVDSDEDELLKDLAVNMARGIDDDVGAVIRSGDRADIEIFVRKLANSDPRVSGITRANVVMEDNTLTIDIEIQTVDGETIQGVFTPNN